MRKIRNLGLLTMLLPLCAQAQFESDGGGRSYYFNNGAGLNGSAQHYQFSSRHGDFYRYNGTPVSRFLVNRQLDGGALHYGSLVSEEENHYYGGVTLGPATLAYFQGEGESFSRAQNPLYEDLNQYYFHGGRRTDFSLSGAGASVDLGAGFSAQAAYSRVSSPNVDDRHGYYAGVSGGRIEGGVFQVDRGDDKVGHGLNLAYRGGVLDLGYQEIQSEYDAHIRRLSLQWGGARAGQARFSLELEQARNDLYADGDDNRIMFRFRKRLGRDYVFNAAENGNGEETKQGGFGKAVAIGVGVGVAAVALSSGSDSDGARRFSVRNNAAFSVLNKINPVSVRQNREHGGWIYRNADNTFGYTDPVAGTVSSVNIGNPITAVPQGTTASASYHTHGGPDPRFDNENFSPQDILSDNLARTDGYLGTPAGFMKLHDFETGRISVVGRINN